MKELRAERFSAFGVVRFAMACVLTVMAGTATVRAGGGGDGAKPRESLCRCLDCHTVNKKRRMLQRKR